MNEKRHVVRHGKHCVGRVSGWLVVECLRCVEQRQFQRGIHGPAAWMLARGWLRVHVGTCDAVEFERRRRKALGRGGAS